MRLRGLLIAIAAVSVTTACDFSANGASSPYETRRSSGEVSFAVTPRAPADGRLTIDIRADTHSGDLAELDLKRITSLEADGDIHHPVGATALSGHHSSGSVTFDLASVPDRFRVRLTGVRNMEPLVFEWP